MGRIHQHKDKCHGEARRGAGRGRFGPNFAADMGGELGHGFGHGRRGRGGRARRGDIRAAVLDVLGQGPLNGYQLIQTISERTEGAWKPSPGSVYPTISQLKDEGLIASTRDGSSRMISLTEQGQAWVEANPETMAAVWTSFQRRGRRRPRCSQRDALADDGSHPGVQHRHACSTAAGAEGVEGNSAQALPDPCRRG